MSKILIVEDNKSLSDQISKFLKRESFETDVVASLEEAGARNIKEFDLMILDWMLPDGQGIDFLKKIRGQGVDVPVIMLTARVELMDKVLGLEMGASDYITKPFEPRELVARIRVQLRGPKSSQKQSTSNLKVGEIEIKEEGREVFYKGKLVDLTKMEYNLLKVFVENLGKVFTRDELLNKVWGFENYPTTRTVDTHVLQLRQKFQDDYFETVRGVGYRMNVKADS